ncbi:hypothetical protein [Streptomyces sp. NPDC058424]|uniref:hypothetical protein n=1 Tax=Streptomyces sp. NPDC058424 TaxID=3346491 RepID=UPI00364F5B2C
MLAGLGLLLELNGNAAATLIAFGSGGFYFTFLTVAVVALAARLSASSPSTSPQNASTWPSGSAPPTHSTATGADVAAWCQEELGGVVNC